MTINDPVAYAASQWDWSIFDGCFGETKIKPTDIDGMVERNGKFLVIETKLPNVDIPQGQLITFRSLVNLGVFSILIIWGHPGKPIKAQLLNTKTNLVFQNVTLEKLRDIMRQWYAHANK